MSNGIYVALSGAIAQSRALDVVANNVANTDTTGYRATRASFDEVLATQDGGRYVDARRPTVDTTAGEMVQSDNPLNVALDGDGFFVVETDKGMRYTRAGDFRLDTDGTLVTAGGDRVQGRNGPLVVPPATAVDFAPDGTLRADGVEIGQLDIVRFPGGSLVPEGGNLFRSQDLATADDGQTQVMSGFVERSNFDAVRGMVDLVRVSRTYEALHRMIENYKDMDQRTARELGGPG